MSSSAAWSILPALPDDAAEIVRLVNSAYRGEGAKRGWTTEAHFLGGQRTDLKEISKILAEARSTILVARPRAGAAPSGPTLVPGRIAPPIVGCVHLEVSLKDPDQPAYLGMLTVNPTEQGGGLGKTLLAAAERYVRQTLGRCEIELGVISIRSELIAWYERRGYRATGETKPFPAADPSFGLPKVEGLEFRFFRKKLDEHS